MLFRCQYDRLGRLTQITDPLAQTTQHSWDAHDNLLSLTDAAGNTHRFAYSKVGQLLKETRPLGGAIQYRYNAAGYLTQRIDAANNTRTYRYDAAGRLIEEEHTLPNGTRDQLSQYAYNKDGQLTGYTQTDGSNQLISSATYDLDEQGRTKTSTTTYTPQCWPRTQPATSAGKRYRKPLVQSTHYSIKAESA